MLEGLHIWFSNELLYFYTVLSLLCYCYWKLKKPVKHIHKLSNIGRRKIRYAKNCPPVYPNTWYTIAESNEVKKEQVKYVAAIGENFAVFRNDRNKIRVMDAYCPHLGINMAIGGEVRGDCIECPYHRWQFSGETGQCTFIPDNIRSPDLAKTKIWKCMETNGLIFVWYHIEGEEPSWYPVEVDEVNNNEYYCYGTEINYVNAHALDPSENVSDSCHFDGIHTHSILSGSQLGNIEFPNWADKILHHNLKTKWKANEDSEKKHLASTQVIHQLILFGINIKQFPEFSILIMGPSYYTLRSQSVIVFTSVTPQEPLLQKILTKVYIKRRSIMCGIYFSFISNMLSRDIIMWNNKAFLNHPQLTKNDKDLVRYRQWIKQFFSKNSITYEQAKASFDW